MPKHRHNSATTVRPGRVILILIPITLLIFIICRLTPVKNYDWIVDGYTTETARALENPLIPTWTPRAP